MRNIQMVLRRSFFCKTTSLFSRTALRFVCGIPVGAHYEKHKKKERKAEANLSFLNPNSDFQVGKLLIPIKYRNCIFYSVS